MDFISRTTSSLKWLGFLTIFCLVIIESTAIDVQCGKPGRAPTGQYEPKAENYSIGSIVTYSCEFPLLVAKPGSRICQADGTWSGTIPLCYNKSILYQFLQSSTLQGKTATKAADNDIETCFSTAWEKDGYWSALLSSRSIVASIRIYFPLDADSFNVEVSLKTENSIVICSTYEHYYGHSPSRMYYCPNHTGAEIVHVRDLSLQDHFFEICEVEIFTVPESTCLFPDVPTNGFGNMMISGLEREYTYFCDGGYDLFGAAKSSCQPPGTWTPKAPVCHRIQCIVQTSFNNGSVYFEPNADDGVIPYSGYAQYRCNPGFVLQGAPKRFCIGWNVLSGDEPVCITKRCGPVTTTVANGELVTNSTAVHSTALLVCNDGYQSLSDDRIQCLPTGQWSHASLICAPIRCDPNPVVPHGSFRLLANSTFYGSRLQVTCDRGYTAKDNGLRMCEGDGKWEDVSDVCTEVTCDAVPEEIPERGIWHLLNDSFRASERTIRVLKCHTGYHIVGTPPIVRCLENGSWSFSVATCMKTPQAVQSTGKWTPNGMLIAAVAAGAGTAVCILCLVGSFVGIRKRRHLRTTTTVFHVGMANPPTFTSTLKGIPIPPEEHYYTTAMYEDIPGSQCYDVAKSRNLPKNHGYDLSKPRKPSAGLPLLPLDTDPVYAQPFETGSTASLADYKLRKDGYGTKDDPYSGHIYAEPIDSRRPPSGSSTVSGCIAETWFRGGTNVKMTRKMSLPDCQQIPKAGSSSGPKVKEVKRTSSTVFLCPEDNEKVQLQESAEHHQTSGSNESLGLFAELQNNSIYLTAGDQDIQPSPLSSGYKIADNDIYLTDYFSSA